MMKTTLHHTVIDWAIMFFFGFFIVAQCCGCAAFTGDFTNTVPDNGTVEVYREVLGNPHPFIGVGAMPYSDGGPRILAYRSTYYVRNRTGHDLYADVTCSDGGFDNRLIPAGHTQGFAEFGGPCRLVGAR